MEEEDREAAAAAAVAEGDAPKEEKSKGRGRARISPAIRRAAFATTSTSFPSTVSAATPKASAIRVGEETN